MCDETGRKQKTANGDMIIINFIKRTTRSQVSHETDKNYVL